MVTIWLGQTGPRDRNTACVLGRSGSKAVRHGSIEPRGWHRGRGGPETRDHRPSCPPAPRSSCAALQGSLQLAEISKTRTYDSARQRKQPRQWAPGATTSHTTPLAGPQKPLRRKLPHWLNGRCPINETNTGSAHGARPNTARHRGTAIIPPADSQCK